jgi:hypothetical protein
MLQANSQARLKVMPLNSINTNRLLRRTMMVMSLGLLITLTPVVCASQQPVPVPQVNANLGSCTVDFAVSQSREPLYNAEISVNISYGFMGVKKMDLKVGTNSEGKARFVGLPDKVHNPPLVFVVNSKGVRKTVNYWPSVKCQARYDVIMEGR